MVKRTLTSLGLISFFSLMTTFTFAGATSDQYLAAGNQLYQAKDYQRAILYYKAAVQVDPNNAIAYQRLGNTYYLLGQKQDALTAYQRALALNPNNAPLAAFVQKLQAQISQGSSPAYYQAKQNYSPVKNFELNAGLGIASGGYGSSLGIGGMASGYFLVDKNLGIGGSLGVYDFSYSTNTTSPDYSYSYYGVTGTNTYKENDSLIAIELLASGKYYFDGQGIKPYIVAGVGLSMLGLSYTSSTNYTYPSYPSLDSSSSSSFSASTINPMLQGGAGLLLSLGPGMDLFGEAKYSLIISSGGSASYIPVNAGLSFNF